ncbi:hypothetical protein CDAR_45041 [Caerostris darwini]|uniref:Uncharacterized protein n=1 Tax=Caerostris darwini TaxID=1538125 RepID=A0AAV4UXM1_9ARAC|nr:hypothetical protein CDAR_45041 [Caerostris darwini]
MSTQKKNRLLKQHREIIVPTATLYLVCINISIQGQTIIPPKWFSLSSPQITRLSLASPKKYPRGNWLVVKNITESDPPFLFSSTPIPGNIARGVFLSAGQKLFLLRHNSRFHGPPVLLCRQNCLNAQDTP